MTDPVAYTSLDQLPLSLRADDLASIFGISRSKAYELMRSKGFPAMRIGRPLRVPRDWLIRWLEDQKFS